MNDTSASKPGKCPHCGRGFSYDSTREPAWLPFCSDRCQWIDLGKWLSGEYRFSKDLLADDDEQRD